MVRQRVRFPFQTALNIPHACLSHGDLLVKPFNPNGIDQPFHIEQGESIRSIATRLEESYIIANAQAFYDYVVYTGLDLTIQSGDYILNPALSIIDITRELQDSTPEDINFVILSGWRMEEIAASLPTSGLDISPEAFIAAAQNPPQVLASAILRHNGRILFPRFLHPAAYHHCGSVP